MNLEQRALKITRSKISYKILEIHIAWRRWFYGIYHDKTRQLVRKRNLIDYEVIQQLRDIQRYYEVMRGEVRLLSGEELKQETNKELDKILHNKKGNE